MPNIVRKTLVLALAVLLLQNSYGGCFCIFAAANIFFQLNLVFIADSRTGFCPELLWKHELNFRSSHWNSSVQKGFLRNSANLTGKHLCWSLFSIELQAFRAAALEKETPTQMFSCWICKIFKKNLIWSLQTTASETLDSPFW